MARKLIPLFNEFAIALNWICSYTSLRVTDWLYLHVLYKKLLLNKLMNYTLDFDITLGIRRPRFEKFYHTLWIVAIIFLLVLGPLILYSDAFVNTRTKIGFNTITISGELSTPNVILPLFNGYKFSRFQNVTKSDVEQIFGLQNYVTDLMYIYKVELNTTDTTNVDEEDFSRKNYEYIYNFLQSELGQVSFNLYINANINNADLTIKAENPLDTSARDQILTVADIYKTAYNYQQAPMIIPLSTGLNNLVQIDDYKSISFVSTLKNSQNKFYLRHVTESYRKVFWDVTNTIDNESANTFELYFIVTSTDKSTITFVKNITLIAFYTSTVLIIIQWIYGVLNPDPVQTWLAWIPFGRKILEIIDSMEIARENFNYYLERMLYLKLINIFRSPELVKAITMETHQYMIEQDKLEIGKQMRRLRKQQSKSKKNIKLKSTKQKL